MRERDLEFSQGFSDFGDMPLPGIPTYKQPFHCYGVVRRGGGNVKAIASFHGKNEVAARKAANAISGNGADVDWIDPGTSYVNDKGQLRTHGNGGSAHYAYKADGAKCG